MTTDGGTLDPAQIAPTALHPSGTYKDFCDGYEWRGEVPWKCRLPLGHKMSCRGTQTIVIDARQPDATTCPGCRVAVPLGQHCSCPMRWKG